MIQCQPRCCRLPWRLLYQSVSQLTSFQMHSRPMLLENRSSGRNVKYSGLTSPRDWFILIATSDRRIRISGMWHKIRWEHRVFKVFWVLISSFTPWQWAFYTTFSLQILADILIAMHMVMLLRGSQIHEGSFPGQVDRSTSKKVAVAERAQNVQGPEDTRGL